MNKPQNYDGTDAQQFSQGQKPPAGAYIMNILSAAETTSGSQRPMVVLMLDIAEGPFAGNFKQLFEFLKKKNPDAKWPCVHRRCTDGNQTAYFKGDIKSIEESNPGYVFNFDEKTLRGKKVGCMLGEKQIGEHDDGSAKTILEPRFLCSVKTAKEGNLKPPAIKPMQQYGSQQQVGSPPYADDSNLPF